VLLVIDDVPGVSASIRVMLSGLFEVLAVAEPADAFKILESSSLVEAILCDVQLANATLEEVFQKVGQLRPALAEKLLLMTGGAFPDDEPLLQQIPSARRLLKPFSTEQVLKALTTVGVRPGSRD
jgi:CheY-like chemotaxis protein